MARVPLHVCLVSLLAFVAMFTRVNTTIFVPEEIPSLLSVVYSNLPPIKKGTDSRLGVGFRLGPNADVQFQLELGPQTNTAAVGPQTAGSGDAKKRHAAAAGPGRITAGAPPNKAKDWLNAWRLQMSPGYVAAVDGDVDGDSAAVDNHSATVAGDSTAPMQDAVSHLKQLYAASSARLAA